MRLKPLLISLSLWIAFSAALAEELTEGTSNSGRNTAGQSKTKVLVNGLAARVGATPITVSDVRFYQEVSLFVQGALPPKAEWEESDLRKALQKKVFEEIAYAELRSLSFPEKGRTEAEAQVRSQRKASAAREKWFREILRKYNRSESNVLDIVYKSMNVNRFVQQRVDTFKTEIPNADIDRFLKSNSNEVQGLSREAARRKAEDALRTLARDQSIKEWIQFLREKYGAYTYLDP